VGSYPPNAFGLYDMHGNVWERCADYHGNGNYKYHATVDPIGRLAREGWRVIRGGSWESDPAGCHAATRYGWDVSGRTNHVGFRVICLIDRATSSETPVPPVSVARKKVKRSDRTLDLGDGGKIEFARIPAGEFMMGAPDSEPELGHNKPQHKVTISKDFYMGIYLVTQEQYEKIIGINPSYFSAKGEQKSRVEGMDTRRFPVEGVVWEEAEQFCRKLSELTGRRCTLPTEAQWEYACRAGTTTPFHFGTSCNGTQANCNGNIPDGTEEKGPYLGRTCAVGSYPANAFGLYDMHGNVWEWCADWLSQDYYQTSETVDPKGPATGASHIQRGCSWNTDARLCRAAVRSWNATVYRGRTFRDGNMGFRVVCLDWLFSFFLITLWLAFSLLCERRDAEREHWERSSRSNVGSEMTLADGWMKMPILDNGGSWKFLCDECGAENVFIKMAGHLLAQEVPKHYSEWHPNTPVPEMAYPESAPIPGNAIPCAAIACIGD
jgi:formylglycine-generating enzyme required for sulfatase activity